MKASVIIPTYKDWPRLQMCLDALASQSLAGDQFEVLVANNNRVADVPADLTLPGNARIVWAEQPGSYAARNVVLAQAVGEVVFFTDSDCVPDRDWVRLGVERMEELPDTDRIAGCIRLFPKGSDWVPAEIYDRLVWLKQTEYAKAGWGTTANLVMRRSLFDVVGPFDASLFSGGDKEWNLRANAKGSVVHYDADVIINHPARGTFAELALKRRRLTGGKHKRQSHSFRRFLPPIRLLIPSFKMTGKLMRHPDLALSTRFALARIDYGLRWVTFKEFIRLRYFAFKGERQ
jgi:glycosyltransferase involved in cell wall biosynthesis